jgi:hypothetical protein
VAADRTQWAGVMFWCPASTAITAQHGQPLFAGHLVEAIPAGQAIQNGALLVVIEKAHAAYSA